IRLCAWGPRLRPEAKNHSWWNVPRFTVVLLVALILFCLLKTSQRLHGNRAGNHRAGLWLASMLTKGDMVVDDHAYSHYYAGQVFEEGKEPVLPKECQPTSYTVITRSKDQENEGDRKKKENELREHADPIYCWPENW